MIENIKIAIETVNENRWGTKFALWENVREHAKKNALLFMTANKMPDADAVALLDFTVMKTGEEGCLISKGGIYFNRLRDKIDLKSLKTVCANKKMLTFTYENGEATPVKVDRMAQYIADTINEFIRLRDGGEPKQKKKDEPSQGGPDVVIVQKSKNNPFSFKL